MNKGTEISIEIMNQVQDRLDVMYLRSARASSPTISLTLTSYTEEFAIDGLYIWSSESGFAFQGSDAELTADNVIAEWALLVANYSREKKDGEG